MCPESHPVALISIGAEFGFSTQQAGLTGQSASTLVLSNGDTTGYGAHADFIQGWQNAEALENSFSNCNGIGTACAWNSFGTPDGSMGTKKDLVPEVAPPVEEIGLNGPIATLPGNNPVYTPGMTYSTPAATGSLVPVSSGAAASGVVSSSHAAGVVSSPAASSTAIIKTLPPTTLQTVASSSAAGPSSIIKALPPTTLVTSATAIKTGAPTTLHTKAVAKPSASPAPVEEEDDDDDDACALKF